LVKVSKNCIRVIRINDLAIYQKLTQASLEASNLIRINKECLMHHLAAITQAIRAQLVQELQSLEVKNLMASIDLRLVIDFSY
jgi:hypothetical protein